MWASYVDVPRWGRPPLADPDDDEGRLSRAAARALARQEERRALFALLGAPLYFRTTVLPLVGGGYLGPAYGPAGQVLRWGLWAPHRRVVIDVFPRALPTSEELEARAAFTRTHALRYAVVRPGWRLTTDSLQEWLAT